MSVATDLATAHGKRRRLFLKVDGSEPILWQSDGTGDVPAWSRSGLSCLRPPQELSMDLDLGTMKIDLSQITFHLDDIKTAAGLSVFGIQFAPGRWGENDHYRINASTTYGAVVDANAATIPLTAWGDTNIAAGEYHVGQEAINTSGNVAQNIAGVTKGLYPITGTAYGYSYSRPVTGGKGANLHVGTVPFSYHGRRVALYVTTWDDDTDAWHSEGDEALLWVGRIADTIQYSPVEGCWKISCTSIIDELGEELAYDLPTAWLAEGINLMGGGLSFRIMEYNHNTGSRDHLWTVDVPSGFYSPDSLSAAINTAIHDEINATGHNEDVWVIREWNGNLNGVGEKFEWGAKTSWADRSFRVEVKADYHVLIALGFKPGIIDLRCVSTAGTHYYSDPNPSADDRPYVSYHPLAANMNGGYMFLAGGDALWTDQGDDDAAQAWLKLEDAQITATVKGNWFERYSAVSKQAYKDTPSVGKAPPSGDWYYWQLTLDTNRPSCAVAASQAAFVGVQEGAAASGDGDGVKVSQVCIPTYVTAAGVRRGPYEVLLQQLTSTGTPGYNGTYDVLKPMQLGMAIQAALVDHQSFLDADKDILAQPLGPRDFYVIDKGIPWYKLYQREAQVFGYALLWNDGKLTVKNVLLPAIDSWTVTLDDSTRAVRTEKPTVDMPVSTAINKFDCKVSYNFTRGKYNAPITVTDEDSKQGLRITRKISLEHPGLMSGVTAAQVQALIELAVLDRVTRFPSQIVRITMAPKYLDRVYPGDVVKYVSSVMPNPLGTGSMSTSTFALVLSAAWNYKSWTGQATLMLLTQYSAWGDPWAPSALVNKDVAGGGWFDGDDILQLAQLHYGEAGDSHDGAAFSKGDQVLIYERSPADPASGQSWGPFEVAENYGTNGTVNLSLASGTTLALYNTDKEHVVTYCDYNTATAAMISNGTWAANDTTEKLNAATAAQRWG